MSLQQAFKATAAFGRKQSQTILPRPHLRRPSSRRERRAIFIHKRPAESSGERRSYRTPVEPLLRKPALCANAAQLFARSTADPSGPRQPGSNEALVFPGQIPRRAQDRAYRMASGGEDIAPLSPRSFVVAREGPAERADSLMAVNERERAFISGGPPNGGPRGPFINNDVAGRRSYRRPLLYLHRLLRCSGEKRRGCFSWQGEVGFWMGRGWRNFGRIAERWVLAEVLRGLVY